MKQKPVTIDDHMAELEKSLMTGRGRWIADFSESKRNVRIGDVEFDAVIDGNTRMKGFILSRLFSFMANPNYSVSCFMISTTPAKKLDQNVLRKILSAIRSYMKNKEIKWSWLFIFNAEKANILKNAVQKIDDRSIGIVLADINSKEIFHSNSYLGRQAKKFVKI